MHFCHVEEVWTSLRQYHIWESTGQTYTLGVNKKNHIDVDSIDEVCFRFKYEAAYGHYMEDNACDEDYMVLCEYQGTYDKSNIKPKYVLRMINSSIHGHEDLHTMFIKYFK